jgi:hypothetical protein
MRLIRTMMRHISMPVLFFCASLSIYLLVRFIGLLDYPIYFFTDEAIQAVSAADLVQNKFYGPEKIFLPTYFKNGTFYNLCLSVYAQIIPYMLWGKSIFITRATSVIITLIAATTIPLALKKIYKIRYWWVGVLILSALPAWFLHSRTAFETVLFTSFYAGFLSSYLFYRKVSSKYLFLTIVLAACAFYSYSPGQVIILLTSLGLLFSDASYHWHQRKAIAIGLPLVVILAIPYLRFITMQSSAPFNQLRDLNSYWMQPLPLFEKLSKYAGEYIFGLNPAYWFIPNKHDLPRHLMDGYGHLSVISLPFFLIGLIYAFQKVRFSEYRALMIALLTVPAGSALVGIGITRVLVFIVPSVFMISIGFSGMVEWLENPTNWGERMQRMCAGRSMPKIMKPRPALIHLVLFLILGLLNVFILRDSLTNGPLWFSDFGLYGMQYGARQVFKETVPDLLRQYPDKNIFISSIWANGADVFVRFFLDPEQQKRVQMGSVEAWMFEKRDDIREMVFVITPEEFEQVLEGEKLQITQIDKIIPYPDTRPGFYIVHMDYVEGVEKIFATEEEERQKLIWERVALVGQVVSINYSQIDSGQLVDAMDGDPHTLIRGLEANPFVLEYVFKDPVSFQGLTADFGSMDFEIAIFISSQNENEDIKLIKTYRNMPNDPHIEWRFANAYADVSKIRVEVTSLSEPEKAKIHIRDIQLMLKTVP